MMGQVHYYRAAELPFFELKRCNSGDLAYKLHSHEEYSLGMVEQGKSIFRYAGRRAEIQSNSLVYLPPDLVHSCNPAGEDWQYMMLFADAKWVEGFLAGRKNALRNRPLVQTPGNGRVRQAMNTVFHVFGQAGVSPLEREGWVMAVWEALFPCAQSEADRCCRRALPGVALIKEYLDSCFMKKITLAELEQVSGLNKFNIIRLFNKSFNLPPHTYQLLLRVNYAKKELRKNRQQTEVALEAGFYDQSHFCKVFKTHTGITPDKYQKCI